MAEYRGIQAGRARQDWRIALALAAATCLLMSGGCYERVVKAKGLGAAGMAVQKPYSSNTMLDNAVMGPPPQAEKRRMKSTNWESTNR